MSQTSKNIRSALKGLPAEERALLAMTAATWLSDPHRPTIAMQALAYSALVDGLPLDTVPTTANYATPAQRRAWAAGALLGCIYQIQSAYIRKDEREAAAARIADLEQRCVDFRIQLRAAWRASPIDVPFREPRKHGHNWQSEAAMD